MADDAADEVAENVPADEHQYLAGRDLPGLADAAEELAQLLARPVAPVRLPPPDQLEVKLVTEQALERAFDAAGDAGLLMNLFVLMVGALFGFFTNVITASQFDWSRAVVTYVTLLVLATLTLGLLSIRFRRRATRLRKQIGRSGEE